MHARQTIREAAATLLTGLTTTGANVFTARAYTLQAHELPALLIHTDAERIEAHTIGAPHQQQRELELVIEAKAVATIDLDDMLDTIAEEIETALAADLSLGVGVKLLELNSLETDINAEGDTPLGSLTLRYSATYFVMNNAPDVIL